MMEIKNKKIPRDEFMDLREGVLQGWSTGKDVNLQESFKFHDSLEEHKIFSRKLIKAKKENHSITKRKSPSLSNEE